MDAVCFLGAWGLGLGRWEILDVPVRGESEPPLRFWNLSGTCFWRENKKLNSLHCEAALASGRSAGPLSSACETTYHIRVRAGPQVQVCIILHLALFTQCLQATSAPACYFIVHRVIVSIVLVSRRSAFSSWSHLDTYHIPLSWGISPLLRDRLYP